MRGRISVFGVILTGLLVISFGASALAQTTTNATTSTAERDARITELKKGFKTKLTAADTAKLQAKCVAAQAILQRASTQSAQGITNRTKVYGDVQTKLASLIVKLEAQNISTAELRNAKTTLATKIDTFNNDAKTYQQSLSDVTGMGCASDPTAFKATLESARKTREQLRVDAEDVNTYVTQTLKPLLKKISDQLQTTSSAQRSQ